MAVGDRGAAVRLPQGRRARWRLDTSMIQLDAKEKKCFGLFSLDTEQNIDYFAIGNGKCAEPQLPAIDPLQQRDIDSQS